MKLRISLHARYLGLMAALGIVPLACDSTIESDFECTGDAPHMVQGQDSGYAVCEEGQRHRPKAVACASQLPRAQSWHDRSRAPRPVHDRCRLHRAGARLV